LINPEPLFLVGQTFHFKQSLYLLFALLGLMAAGFSIFAMQAVTWAERGWKSVGVPAWLRPAIGGLVLSCLALLFPQVLGSGHGAIQFQFNHSWALVPLVALLLAKLAASSISIGSGFRGGMFSSALLLGVLFGAAFADMSAMILPRLGAQHAALMMVGMGSVAAAIVGAPLTMVFLVLEGTGDFPMTAGVMVGVVIASTITRLAFGYSFSTWRFHQRGLAIRSPHDIGWIADLTAGTLMRLDPKIAKSSLSIAALREGYPLGSAKRVFVSDGGERYAGAIDMDALHDLKKEHAEGVTAAALAQNPDKFLLPYDNVRTALARFDEWQVETLPVLDSRADRRVVGYVTEAYALRRYNQELERRRSAETGERELFNIAEPPD
jgi:CIC family chloride channel protein